MSVDLSHGASVIGKHWQEVNKFRDLLFWIRFVYIQPTAIVSNLPEGPVQREVEHIALLLHDLTVAELILDLPRGLNAKRSLEVGFRAFKIPQHKYAGPGLYGHAGGELTTGESYGVRL